MAKAVPTKRRLSLNSEALSNWAALAFTIVGGSALTYFLVAYSSLSAARLQGIRVELICLAWFIVVFLIEIERRFADAAAHGRFRFYLYCVAIVGIALITWVVSSLGLTTARALPYQHWIAAACIAGVFLVAASSTRVGEDLSIRHVVQDLGLVAFNRRAWLSAVAFIAVAVLVKPPPPQVTRGRMGAEFLEWFVSQPRAELPESEAEVPVVIVEFIDYQCPACRTAVDYYRPMLDRFLSEYPGSIRMVTYDFPLDAECNDFGSLLGHEAACEAAVAVRVAEKHGVGAEMRAWLWENQPSLSPRSVLASLQRIAGISLDDATYRLFLNEVTEEVAFGYSLGVRGTPTYFLNGVRMTFNPASNFTAAIEHELRTAGVMLQEK